MDSCCFFSLYGCAEATTSSFGRTTSIQFEVGREKYTILLCAAEVSYSPSYLAGFPFLSGVFRSNDGHDFFRRHLHLGLSLVFQDIFRCLIIPV